MSFEKKYGCMFKFSFAELLESCFLPISIYPQVLSLSLDMVDPEDPKGRGGLNQRVVEGIKYQPINWLEFPSP